MNVDGRVDANGFSGCSDPTLLDIFLPHFVKNVVGVNASG